MKKKVDIPLYEPIPTSSYILMFAIFVGIIYLIVLRKRVDEFFALPTQLLINRESNPSEIEKVWEGTFDNVNYLSIWQKKDKKTQDLYRLGQFALQNNHKMEALPDDIIDSIPILNMLAKGGKYPISYVKIWSSDLASKKPTIDMSIWQAVPPDGYTALGDIVVPSLSPPARNKMVCIPNESLAPNKQIKDKIINIEGEHPMSVWTIGNYSAFMGNQNVTKPEMRKEEIMELKEDSLLKKANDPNEVYDGIKISMKTF
jgi:hypothetical protein